MTEQFTFHILGEPTAHPHFSSFVELAQEESAPLNLTTNGLLLHRPEIIQALLNPSVRQVNISVQAWSANFKTPEQIEAQIQKTAEFIKIAEQHRPDLYINLRLWNIKTSQADLNQRQFVEPLLKALGVPFFEVQIDVARIKSKKIRGRLYFHFDSRFEWPDLRSPLRSSVGTCYGLRNHIGILADGRVIPCCLDSQGVLELGNVQNSSLVDIFNSPRAQNMKEGFLKNELREELCQKCDYVTRFTKNTRPKKSVTSAQGQIS